MSSSEIYSILQSTKAKRTSYVLLDNALYSLVRNINATSTSCNSAINSLYNGYVTDDGKTINDDMINNVNYTITNSLSKLNDIKTKVSNKVLMFDVKISSLKAQYNAALAREREAALRNSKNGK